MINWPAMATGVVAAFILGFVIYGPLLGLQRRWAEGTRINPDPPSSMPIGSMAVQIVSLILLSLIIAITETSEDIVLAILAIVTVAAHVASVGVWAQKTGFAIAVDTGYAIGAGAVMILAQGIL